MPITILWQEAGSPDVALTLPDAVVSSLDKFRQTITKFDGTGMIPTYPTVRDMFVGVFLQTVMMPALTQFPTLDIQAAQLQVSTAQGALAAVQAATVPEFTPVVVAVPEG